MINNDTLCFQKGYTALHYAALYGHMEVCAWLLEQGVDVNVVSLYLVHDDKPLRLVAPLVVTTPFFVKLPSCFEPLHCAALGGWTSICRLLLINGANVNSRCVSGKLRHTYGDHKKL
jgi:ankyrin repeat protein